VLPIGYAGGLTDPATGLAHFGFRDYEPASGRWTAIDPALYGGGQANLYAYAGNDPTEFRDPTGMFCVAASGYRYGGVGAEICVTEKGTSACVEGGAGAGESVEVNPYGGLATQGLSIVAEIQASYEVGTASATWTLTPCMGSDGSIGLSNNQVDAKFLLLGQGFKGSVSQSGNDNPQVSGDFSLNKAGDAGEGTGTVGIEGKVVLKECRVALF
jgi:RHS repeat-associated protein